MQLWHHTKYLSQNSTHCPQVSIHKTVFSIIKVQIELLLHRSIYIEHFASRHYQHSFLTYSHKTHLFNQSHHLLSVHLLISSNKKLTRRSDSKRELDIVYVPQNTIDSCINSTTDRRGYVLERMFTKFSQKTQCNGHYAVQGHPFWYQSKAHIRILIND